MLMMVAVGAMSVTWMSVIAVLAVPGLTPLMS